MDSKYIQSLLDKGFNCMPIKADKLPFGGWKDYQDKKIHSLDEFKDSSNYYALICGFTDIECIDIDLKVILDFDRRKIFKNELFNMFNDNIEDFSSKVVIKKTRSGGYHVIYRAQNIEGNKKIAHFIDYQEAVIETKGIGGYICMYDNVYHDRNYHDMKYITDEDRDIIITICKTFNEVEKEKIIEVDNKVKKQFIESDITPWTDFNNKNRIWDIISSEFSIVHKTSSKLIIRRNGAKSPHSGYIYNNSDCMFLFSTGTSYPNEKLISPFMAYAIKKHNGDFSKAASSLYTEGYGSRHKPVLSESINLTVDRKKISKQIDFPIGIFPADIQTFILESNSTLNLSIDYMSVALLWAASLTIGNTLSIEVKKGWREISTLWIAIVGTAGVGKSPALTQILKPLLNINANEIRKYQKEKKLYQEFEALDKGEKALAVEVQEPVRTQFIVDDVTIEALINLHSQNKNGIGVFKDELAGWFKDMNKYKEGSDKEQWLSSWSGKGISVDRITRQSDFIERPILPVLGGIQPSILTTFFTSENKENGFLDRMLFSFPDLTVDKYNDNDISQELLDYYSNWLVCFYEELKKIITYNENNEIEPLICYFTDDAKKEWIRIHDYLTDQQNSDDTPEFLKSMLPKQKSYIPRFALIINTLNVDTEEGILMISKKSILAAEKLSKYFIMNNEKMIISNSNLSDEQIIFKNAKGNVLDKIKAMLEVNENFNKAELSKELKISRKTLYNYINTIKAQKK